MVRRKGVENHFTQRRKEAKAHEQAEKEPNRGCRLLGRSTSVRRFFLRLFVFLGQEPVVLNRAVPPALGSRTDSAR